MTKYLAPIDPHVHLRGEEYAQDYFTLAFEQASRVGLCGMFEMPNPLPQLTTVDLVSRRMARARDLHSPVRHGVHIGLTEDLAQVRAAFSAIMQRKAGLVSAKIYFVHSTGLMGIIDPAYQRQLWKEAAGMGFRGIILGHFEDEAEFAIGFDASNPVTHSQRQNPEAEALQVERQLRNAYDAGYDGTFWICHVSNPATVDLVRSSRFPFRIVLEASWHHLFLNFEDYGLHGNRVKMNPPLRSRAMQEALLERALSDHFDVLGSDHAPHPLDRKDHSVTPASGIPAIPFWPKGIELLRSHGMPESMLRGLLFEDANEILQLELPAREVEGEYDPTMWDAYGYNPFSRVDGSR